jgi:hypothetical protein
MCTSVYLLNTDLWSYSKFGEELGGKAVKGRVGTVLSVFLSVLSANPLNPNVWSYSKTATKLGNRGRKIEKKLRPATRGARKLNNYYNDNQNRKQNQANQNRNRQNVQRLTVTSASGPVMFHSRIGPRGLEDDEELSRRDLDDEEVFGRDFDLLDERDAFDDLD